MKRKRFSEERIKVSLLEKPLRYRKAWPDSCLSPSPYWW